MILFFDVGGTKTRFALSDGIILGKVEIVHTPQSYDEGLDIFRKIKNQYAPEAVIGGLPGPLNQEKSMLIAAPHIRQWAQKPVKSDLENIFSREVLLENDAALAGLGEATIGAGKDFGIVAYMTVSTGVGGARIVNGMIDLNVRGFEIGHHIVEITSGRELESFISGSALENEFHKSPIEISDQAIWNRETNFIAAAVQNMIVFWSPDVIVLGGAIVGREDIRINEIMRILQKTLTIFKEHPLIKKAELGDAAALYGALRLFQTLKQR